MFKWQRVGNTYTCHARNVTFPSRSLVSIWKTITLYPQRLVCDIPRDVVDELCRSDVNPGNITFVTLHSNVSETIRCICRTSRVCVTNKRTKRTICLYIPCNRKSSIGKRIGHALIGRQSCIILLQMHVILVQLGE